MNLSLVIPAYNEEKRLKPFLQSIVEYVDMHPHDIDEILVIDDGSTDATSKVAESFITLLPLRILRHAINQGKGAAVQTGVLQTRGDIVIFMDADGATGIQQLPKMTMALRSHDIGIGNRWLAGAKTQRHSSLRRFSGWLNRKYMQLLGFGDIDTMCGFKGYRRAVAHALFTDLEEKRWLFDTEIAYRSILRKYTIANFPIHWESKDGSKLSTITLIKSALAIYPLVQKIQKQEKTRT